MQHHIGNNGAGHQNISNIIAGESQDDAVDEPKQGEEEEIDFDNIDYEQLDPQILEIANQMGVHPREVLKQIMEMNNNEGEEQMEEEEEEMEG